MFAVAQPIPSTPAGGRLVAVDGRTLPLQATHLAADACAGLCRTVLTQRFVNPHAEPLEVTYQVPLPSDGAVSGYAFHIGETRVVGRIDRLADARQAFTEAVLSGRTAALLEQDRSSLFTQTVGNIPPSTEVVVELTIDQPLSWRSGGWEWRFPTVVAPRYLGEDTPDPKRVSVDVADGPISARASLSLSIRDPRTGRVNSPSHAVTDGDTVVLAGADARLDRDVVVRWPVAAPTPGLSLDRGRRAEDTQAFGALTVVPPTIAAAPVPRDLIVLLDTSGSMGGSPLEQARTVTAALIDGLTDVDRLELIEFSTRPRRWRRGAILATPKAKADARRWLSGLRAAGGTRMHEGILAALEGLRAEAQRQVVLVTDGLIGSERRIVQAVRDGLPNASRVHTVGIGHGVNRSLTGPTARAGAGVELILAPGEDVGDAARTLLARTAQPQVVDLEVSGSALLESAPRRLPDLFAGAPARLALALDPHGGELEVRGRTADGAWVQRISVPPTGLEAGAAGVVALFGRERVEDLELDAATGASVDGEIEALGLRFGIATRLTAWIAATETATVDATAATRQETMPHLLAQGMSAEGVGLRPVAAFGGAVMKQALRAQVPMPAMAAPMPGSAPMGAPPAPMRPMAKQKSGSKGGRLGRSRRDRAPQAPAPMDGFSDDEELEEAAPMVEGSLTLAGSRGGGTPLQGTVSLQTDTRLVITVKLAEAVDWAPGDTVTLICDGEVRTLEVEPATTTALGHVPGGRTVRLSLVLDTPLTATPRVVQLADGKMILL